MIFIVGITKTSNSDQLYRLLLVKKGDDGKPKYEMADVTDGALKAKMAQGMQIENAALVGNRLKGTTGSLDRFLVNQNPKPFVILSEIVDASGTKLGYRIADCNGMVKAVKLDEILKFCRKIKQAGGIVFQNGIYVEKSEGVSEHIRSFKKEGYPKEVFGVRKKVNDYKSNINYADNKKNASKIEEIFNPQQIEQLKLGKQHGVDITVYANKALSAEQMCEIRKGLESKVNVKLYADPRFSVTQMKRLRAEMEAGYDVSPWANPAYSIAQMTQIKLGVLAGIDISLYANPKTTAEEMSEIRMRLEAGIWCDCEASKIDPSKL